MTLTFDHEIQTELHYSNSSSHLRWHANSTQLNPTTAELSFVGIVVK